MQHFPIFLAVAGRRIVVAGGGEAAVAKLRLLLKTEGHLTVVDPEPCAQIEAWAEAGRLALVRREMAPGDAICAALVYAATEDAARDARVKALGTAEGALVNIVDDLAGSQFITPAIVDRDPVVVAIGTEGAAPVLARSIKRDLEERLSPRLGALARVGRAFRAMSMRLAPGRARRDFWADWYGRVGPAASEADAPEAIEALLSAHLRREGRAGFVSFVGAGPGDPGLLTLTARDRLHEADVVIHDRLVPAPILELARREAVVIEAGKTGFGAAMPQAQIDALVAEHAGAGAQVVRLKSGDPSVFGRLDEEIAALDARGIGFEVVPGITAASAAAATLGRSLTRRGRNSEARLITGHDVAGFADHDWAALARPGAVAALYMGKRAARRVQGRLLMHGADPATPVTAVMDASRPSERRVATTLGALEPALSDAALEGPAVILLGLAPHAVEVPALEAAQ
ncbi:MAG: siroheme synthase CysG [Paracoccaceae bacterium]